MGIKNRGVIITSVSVATLALSLSSCSAMSTEAVSASGVSTLNADPSLFAPPTDEFYALEGEIVGAEQTVKQMPMESSVAEAHGLIVVTDGIMYNAEITATVDTFETIKFELTEPVFFERHGQISDMIVGVGKITTSSGIFNDAKVILSPADQDSNNNFDAILEIPYSLGLDADSDIRSVQLSLNIEQVEN